jgi:hypothetical protein
MQIDLKAIADGVIRNNMGVGAIELRVRGKVQGGQGSSGCRAGTAKPRPWCGGRSRTARSRSGPATPPNFARTTLGTDLALRYTAARVGE